MENNFCSLGDFKFDYEQDYQQFMMQISAKLPKEEMVEYEEELDSRFDRDVEKVYDEENNFYNVHLVNVVIQKGYYSKNVYYKMQIGKDNNRNIFILFTNWGRIGTEGQFQITPFFKFEDCLKEFNMIFKQKTGNNYSERKDFVKKHNKYFYVKPIVQYDDARIVYLLHDKYQLGQSQESLLPEKLKKLIRLNFNWEFLKHYYKKSQYMTTIYSFGSVEVKNYYEALTIINDIEKRLQKRNLVGDEMKKNYYEILNMSERLYELIPMIRNPNGPLSLVDISFINQYKPRIEQYISFHYMEQILMASFFRHKEINPIDYCYQVLGK